MKKPLSQAYIDELDRNHDITGVPRIRAEWNWNNTSLVADNAKRGPLIDVYDSAGLMGGNATSFGNMFTQARFRKQLNHTSINWTHEQSTPWLDWSGKPKKDYNPQLMNNFAVEQTFYIDVKETGTWRFFVSSDDAFELYVENIKVASYYGARYMPNKYSESGGVIFNAPGRYKMRARLWNVDIEWGIFVGYQTPSMIAAAKAPKELDSSMTINPIAKDAPLNNPDILGYDPDSAVNDAWKEWRDYFPVSSLIESLRPQSGIHYNEINSRNDDCYIMSPENFVFTPGQARPPRYYTLSKMNEGYKYWKSDLPSNSTGALSGATVRVTYTQFVGMNKLLLTMNLGPRPTSMTIRYLTRDSAGVENWVTILNPGDAVPINLNTGELNYYRNSDGLWTTQSQSEENHIVYKADYSVPVKAIEFTIHKINKSNARAEVIEFGARKQLDITDRVVDFSAALTMDEADFTRIIGKLSANDGNITISNWDNAFQMDELAAVNAGVERLKQVTERSAKFTFDLLYDLTNQQSQSDFPVRMATMYSSDWARDGEYDYSINLFDSAKFLQNITCPEIYEKNTPVHVLAAQILDSVGFGRYALDREDYNLTAPVIDFFANEADATVWDVLNKLSESAMCAFYFDEYDVLQMLTKEEITRRSEPDYTLRGQVDIEEPDKISNLQKLDKLYDIEANKVTVKWRPKAIKTSKDVLNPQDLTDIVWQSSDTITLRATKLSRDLSYAEENDVWIRQQDAKAWPWSGKANINGEVIAWEGKEYKWIDGKTGKVYYDILYNQDQMFQRDSKAVYGYNREGVNQFTGLIKLKRDPKTNKPIGRGADSSKYRIDHPINRRPGWTAARFTVGNPGFIPGYWPGEQNTSFYTVSNENERTTALGLNRPTNANDDWFKTQCLYRAASAGAKLQQWGFKMKFKESATIGEVSLMFNMGQSFGNSEVVTTAGGPASFNQMYHLTFLETQNLVRNATHEIGAWVQSPDPVYRKQDNAIRGSASRMYNRYYNQPWAERMKGYQFEFKRDVWYDVKVDLTRGRGYQLNADMHFFVWINGSPVAGFNAAGPANRHKFLAPTNYWALGSRAASKVEIANAYSWTEFADPIYEEEQYRYDFTSNGFISSYLENGILYPAKGKTSPYRDGAQFAGELFFDDFGSTLHEIRDIEINLDKAPVETVSSVISNPAIREMELTYSPNKAKFSVVNLADTDTIAHGSQDLGGGQSVNHSMVLAGYVLEEQDEQTLTRKNRDSIKDHGEVGMDIDADWVNTRDQADNLAKWVVEHFAEPKDVIEIGAFADASYSVGDKIKIVYDKAEIDPGWLYIISKVDMSYSGTEGLEVNLTARRIRSNPAVENTLDD